MGDSIRFEEALKIVDREIMTVGFEKISVYEAVGRVVAEKVYSVRDLPPYDNSAMDGYAFIFSDITSYPKKLKVIGNIGAGADISGLKKLSSGECYRIMTGAFIPSGADTVIQHEFTDNGKEVVSINKDAKHGANIREKATDIKVGDEIDFVGEKVTAYHIARFISAGVFYIKVYRKVRIAVISTGDEIADLSEMNNPLKTFDSNGSSMKALLSMNNTIVDYLGVFPDQPDKLMDAFSQLNCYDMVVTSAGIAVGDFDVMNIVAERLKIDWKFNKINQKPGQHFAFGKVGNSYLFSCPGNPVSSLFCAYFYILPAVYKLAGIKKYNHKKVKAVLTEEVFKKKERVEFERGVLKLTDKGFSVTPLSGQESYKISSMVKGNAFIVFDSVVGKIEKGSMLDCYIFSDDIFLG